MTRNNVDIEMRWNASAGQKVLACLLVRFTLAEMFSSQCGIIALDEPTTNLDWENIESLACSIMDLAQNLNQKKNLQIICITHDEDLVNMLGNDVQTWNVDRNGNGVTKVSKRKVEQIEKELLDDEDDDDEEDEECWEKSEGFLCGKHQGQTREEADWVCNADHSETKLVWKE